jgi:hypothetical protein
MNECCKNPENLRLQPPPGGVFVASTLDVPGNSQKRENQKFTCQVCGRNHYRLMAEPGRLGAILAGSALGK